MSTLLLRSLLIGLSAWLVHLLLRKGELRWRAVLYRTTFVMLLLLPLAGFIPFESPLPGIELPIDTAALMLKSQRSVDSAPSELSPASDSAVSPSTDSAVSPSTDSAVSPSTDSAVSLLTDSAVSLLTDSAVSSLTDSAVSSAAGSLHWSPVYKWLLIGWLTLALCLFLLRSGQMLRMNKRLKALPDCDTELAPEVVGTFLATKISRDFASPFIFGLINPLLILPARLLKNEALMAAALRHEAMHARNRDHFFCLIQEWVKCLYFWNPLIHLISGQFDRLQEELADEAVTEKMPPRLYAGMLLDYLENDFSGSEMRSVAMMISSGSAMHQRIGAVHRS